MPLSITFGGTGACTSVSHCEHTHLPRTWRSTVKTPGLVVLLLRDASPMRLSAQPQWQVVLCGVLHVATRQME
jgi:hypothetical protein